MKMRALRLAEVFGDETDGLGTEVFGMEALATIGEGIGQRRATSYPRIQAVQRHMRVAIRFSATCGLLSGKYIIASSDLP